MYATALCVCVQVEHVLFPELGGHVLELSSVGVEEAPVTSAREEALARLRSNLPGPHKYVPLDLVDTITLHLIPSQVCGCCVW